MKIMPPEEIDAIEAKMQGMACACGNGTITVRNNVMLCSACGYGATIKIKYDRGAVDEA